MRQSSSDRRTYITEEGKRGYERDEYLALDDLAKALIDETDNRFTKFDMVLDEWAITGRKGHHSMKFRIRLVAKTDKGESYVLSTIPGRAYEDGELTIDLPRKSMTLGVSA